MKHSFIFVLALTCCMTAGCDSRFQIINREAELENAFEALIRSVFVKQVYAQNTKDENARPIFLSINGKDPSSDFLKRFAKSKIQLKSGSESKEKDFWFSISSWEWIASDELEIATRYYCGLKCGGSARYVLVRNGESWRVAERKNEVEE